MRHVVLSPRLLRRRSSQVCLTIATAFSTYLVADSLFGTSGILAVVTLGALGLLACFATCGLWSSCGSGGAQPVWVCRAVAVLQGIRLHQRLSAGATAHCVVRGQGAAEQRRLASCHACGMQGGTGANCKHAPFPAHRHALASTLLHLKELNARLCVGVIIAGDARPASAAGCRCAGRHSRLCRCTLRP